MALHKTLSADQDHLLVDKGQVHRKSLLIVNKATSGKACKIILFIYDPIEVDGAHEQHEKLITYIPPSTTLLINEPMVMNYDHRQFQLKINTTVESGTSNLEITIN